MAKLPKLRMLDDDDNNELSDEAFARLLFGHVLLVKKRKFEHENRILTNLIEDRWRRGRALPISSLIRYPKWWLSSLRS